MGRLLQRALCVLVYKLFSVTGPLILVSWIPAEDQARFWGLRMTGTQQPDFTVSTVMSVSEALPTHETHSIFIRVRSRNLFRVIAV